MTNCQASFVRGKEQSFSRPQAGMIFYNDEGSENGGLIFSGHRNEKGDVVDSGGSLSFDKYADNQIVQLAGVDDKEDKFAGLIVSDNNHRIWVGRDEKGDATVTLMDFIDALSLTSQNETNPQCPAVRLSRPHPLGHGHLDWLSWRA
jgi:hypothetical protein